MFLKKSCNLLKNNFYGLFFSELVFLFATFFFMVFAKNKLAGYILKVQEFSARAAAIQQGADQTQLLQFLEGFEQVTSQAMIFAYVLVPLVLTIIWLGTQTWFWYTLKKKNIKSFIYKSLLSNIIVFGILSIIIFFSKKINLFENTDLLIFQGILIILSLIFFLIFYSMVNNESFSRSFLNSFKLFLKVVGILSILGIFILLINLFIVSLILSPNSLIWFIIIYLIDLGFLLTIRSLLVKRRKNLLYLVELNIIIVHYLSLFILLVYLFFSLFTTYMEGTIILFSTVPMALYVMVMMVVGIWLKLMFYTKIQEIK